MPPPATVLLQYLLPRRTLTELAGRVGAARGGAATTALIRWFVGRFGVNMREAAEPDPAKYATFNDFFTRALKPGARPIASADFVCPVDGAISQVGSIERDQIIQAKGHSYSTTALLGGIEALAEQFIDGSFATIYLSPKDYHRIHMPIDGRLTRMIYVPGDLFSVNPETAQHVPGLFARNERLVCMFENEQGPFVMVLVGATIVGSMQTTWHGVVNAERSAAVREWNYADQHTTLRKGEEMGRFLLGSTVIMLFPSQYVLFTPRWKAGLSVRQGEGIGISYPRTAETRI
jgi:phosphatidylserine decarboxylase